MSDPRNELDAMIEAERGAMVPDEGARDAGWAALQRKLADGVTPVVDVPPATPAGVGNLGKLMIGLGVLGLVGFAFSQTSHAPASSEAVQPPAVSQTGDPREAAAPAPAAPAPVAPKPVSSEPPPEEPTHAVPTPATEPPPPSGPRAPASERRPSKSAEARPAASMEDELKLLEQAKAALNRGDAKAALATLRRHQTEFPRGLFVEERRAMHVEALCADDRIEEGRRARDRFLKRYAKSPFVDRVKGACTP